MNTTPTNIPARMLAHLRKTRPAEFVAADIADALNLKPKTAAGYLKTLPGVTNKGRQRGGNRYTFMDPEAS